MLRIKPTKNLIGVTVEGDYDTLSDLVYSIYNLTCSEDPELDPEDPHFAVKNRLLGICYDLRHAYQGDRQVFLEDNGMNRDKMKWHELITPEQNVYYRVNLLFPEVVFAACAVPRLYPMAGEHYGVVRKGIMGDLPPIPYADFYRDKANLNVFFAGVWQALGEAIGHEDVAKILRMYEREHEYYVGYIPQFLDKCNMDLLYCDSEKRKDKLKRIARSIVRKPKAYEKMRDEIWYWAMQYDTSIYNIRDPRVEYPDEIEW